MALSAPNTPRRNLTTPRKITGRSSSTVPETPECFNNVSLETPISGKKRISKEKFDEISNLSVAVRIRPMNAKELSCFGVNNVVQVKDDELIISNPAGINHIFQYDHVFWSCDETSLNYVSQNDVFTEIGKPLLTSAFRGYNACLFAYGQTGSGKSYSMMGPSVGETVDINSEANTGIIPRFCRELFAQIGSLSPTCTATVEVSYFEIYNEKIHDLLATSSNHRMPLKVREHPVWGPYVVDLSLHLVKSYKELRGWLNTGNKNRATAATAMNENSSRSHSIFSIELSLLEGTKENDVGRRSKVSLVDLAGSERLGNTNNSEEKLRQGVSINKSLLTLGKVICALAEQKKGNQFVPYRESVLTWLLRESLGGNSLTSMLATITPASSHVDETLATLRYACQARSIVNRVRINENPHDRLIRELRAEVERLRALRQDYERNTSSQIITINDSIDYFQEMEDLKQKLMEKETNLMIAQEEWERKFKETRRKQLEELAEAERNKEELLSHVRVLSSVDPDVNLSPYRSNFLKEVEGALNVPKSVLGDLAELCFESGYYFEFTFDPTKSSINIVDHNVNKIASFPNSRLENVKKPEDVVNLIERLKWTNLEKWNRSEITDSMKQIYNALSILQPITEEDEKLRLAFAKFSTSVQSFESALNNSVNKAPLNNKTVKFRL